MKLSIVMLVGAISTALAVQQLAKRTACNAPAIISGIISIQSSISRLDTDFKNIKTGSSINLTPIFNDNNALISAINSQATSVSSCSPALDSCAAVSVQVQAISLLFAISALGSDIIAKSAQITSNNLGGVVRIEASSQLSAATNYGSALKSKIPGCLASAVAGEISIITRVISSVIATFS